MLRVIEYSTTACPIWDRSKFWLGNWNIDDAELRIDTDNALLKELSAATPGARRYSKY